MSNQSIAEAIAAAQAAASSLPAVAAAASTAVSTQVATPGAPLGLDDMLSGGVAVDHWLKVTQFGLTIGDKTKPLDEIEVYLDMSEIAYNYAVKYQLNGSAVYHKSYDRVTDAQGGSWAETLMKAKQIDAKSFEYRSAEIPLVAAVAVESQKKGENACEAGERLGLTLSTTGWKNFQNFVNELKRKQIDPRTATVKLTLGFEQKTKTGVNPWGIPTFLKVEEVEVIPLFETVH